MECVKCKRRHETIFKACPGCLKQARDWKKNNAQKNRESNRSWKNNHWARRIISHSMDSDKNKNRMPAADYITVPFLHELRDRQDNRCHHCTIGMQVYNRKLHDGLTVQRLDNSKGHCQGSVVLACHSCNCRRVETGCNNDYVREKKARLYFEHLVAEGYARMGNRTAKIINATA